MSFSKSPRLSPYLIKQSLISIYAKEKSKIEQTLQLQKDTKGFFSITLDAWTASNSLEFLGITIHYLDDNFKIHSTLLYVETLEEKHFGVYLASTLIKVLKK